MLQRLPHSHYPTLFSKYLAQHKYFPLIGATLMQLQQGEVYWDGKTENYFVIHSFGFCQLLELEESTSFKHAFKNMFLVNRLFQNNKLRWYDINKEWQDYITKHQLDKIVLVDRIQFDYPTSKFSQVSASDTRYHLDQMNEHNFDEVNHQLPVDLANRFWPSKAIFLQNSFGAILYDQQKPVSICYACAVSNDYAEIDIFTNENYRQQGLASLVLAKFLELCISQKIKPNWDCYINNHSSLQLAKKFGFIPRYQYCHAIIEK